MFLENLLDKIHQRIEKRLRDIGVVGDVINAGNLAGEIDVDVVNVPHPLWGSYHTDVNTADPRSSGDVLTWNGTHFVLSPPIGFTSPLTTRGDLLSYDSGVPVRVAIGPTNYMLTVVGGYPTWRRVTDNPNFFTPLTTGNIADPELIFADGDVILVAEGL